VIEAYPRALHRAAPIALIVIIGLIGGCERKAQQPPPPEPIDGSHVQISAWLRTTSPCQQGTIELLRDLEDAMPARVSARIIDISTAEGRERWQEHGLDAVAIEINGNITVTWGEGDSRRTVSFMHPPGFAWTHEDLRAAVEAALEGELRPADPAEAEGVRLMDVSVRGQSIRVGRAIILGGVLEADSVTFQTKLEGLRAAPGAVIKIHDPSASGLVAGGRIVDSGTDYFAPDREVTLEAGKSYSLTVLDSAGGVRDDLTVTSAAGSYGPDLPASLIEFSPSIPGSPLPGSVWLLQSDDPDEAGATTLWRVVSIQEKGKRGETDYQIEALRHDPGKYAQIESGIDATPYPVPLPDQEAVPAPTDVALIQGWKTLPDGTRVQALTLTFTPSTYARLTHHKALISSPAGETEVHVLQRGLSTFTLLSPQLGEYTAVVEAYGTSRDGLSILKSPPVSVIAEVLASPEGLERNACKMLARLNEQV